jgi:septin family protein
MGQSKQFIFINIVENSNHCDFIKLRKFLIEENILDLINSTHALHYGRSRALFRGGKEISIENLIQENETYIFEEEAKKKEDFIKQMFVEKVYAKEQEIRYSSKLNRIKEEKLEKLRAKMVAELEKISDQLLKLESECAELSKSSKK